MQLTTKLTRQIINTKFDFFLYNLDANDNIKEYRFSNDIIYSNNNRMYKYFKVISTLKTDIQTIKTI